MATYSYDKKNDILVIHKGFTSDEKFKGNIDARDVILDVSSKGRIRGIEVFNATAFFKDTGISGKVLQKIKKATFAATFRPSGIILGLVITSRQKELPAKVVLPLEVPIL